MRRTLILLLAVVLLGGLAYLAVSGGGGATKADDRAFGYPDEDAIDRIFLADREGNQTELRRGGPTGWTVNGFPANENATKNLLQAVTRLEIRSLPAPAAVPNLVRTLAGGGILVRLFDRSGKKLRGYYIGGGTNDELGTAAIVEDAEQPYIVHLPMWSGNVRHRFNLRGDEWRSKRLFAADPERVELLSIAYPRQESKGFTLRREATGAFTVAPLVPSAGPVKRITAGEAERVLARYERFYISRYQNGDEAGKSADKNRLPFASIRLRETGSREQVVDIYPRFRFPDSADHSLSAYTAFIHNGRDYALLAVETTQPLLIGYDAF